MSATPEGVGKVPEDVWGDIGEYANACEAYVVMPHSDRRWEERDARYREMVATVTAALFAARAEGMREALAAKDVPDYEGVWEVPVEIEDAINKHVIKGDWASLAVVGQRIRAALAAAYEAGQKSDAIAAHVAARVGEERERCAGVIAEKIKTYNESNYLHHIPRVALQGVLSSIPTPEARDGE